MPKPKYQIGDEVWVMYRNKPHKVVVTGISSPYPAFDRVQYILKFTRPELTTFTEGPYEESDLFPTKEELLASL